MSSKPHNNEPLFVAESLLSRLMDDHDLVKQVLDACTVELSSNLDLFQQRLSEGNVEEARRMIHTIKGSAKNTDLRSLATLSSEIEDDLRDGDLEKARGLATELSLVVVDSLAAVDRYFSDRS